MQNLVQSIKFGVLNVVLFLKKDLQSRGGLQSGAHLRTSQEAQDGERGEHERHEGGARSCRRGFDGSWYV